MVVWKDPLTESVIKMANKRTIKIKKSRFYVLDRIANLTDKTIRKLVHEGIDLYLAQQAKKVESMTPDEKSKYFDRTTTTSSETEKPTAPRRTRVKKIIEPSTTVGEKSQPTESK